MRVVVFVLVGVISVLVVATVLSRRGQRRAFAALEQTLMETVGRRSAPFDSSLLADVPEPVAKYLRLAMPGGYRRIEVARLKQEGTLRTGTNAERWFSFTAQHLAVPPAVGFVWNARVAVAPLVHLRVLDALINGEGSGQVTLLSTFTVGADGGTLAMNSGSLHRYLAEAVWYPSALFPSSALSWSPIDATRATATLTVGDLRVSLAFRFNERGEVTGIYTPARWGRFAGEYAQVAWEGHFRHYEMRGGVRIPTEGEVGWYVADVWQVVWRGKLNEVQYELAS